MDERDRAFTEYVHVRASAMLRTAVYLCAGDTAEAEDLVQNTLVRAYASWHRVRDAGSRDAYVRRIMVRLSYRRARSASRRLELDPERPRERSRSGVDQTDAIVDRQALLPFLRELPAQQRAVVVLRFYEDLSERDIADALGCAPGTVKSHASRALATLRARLDAVDHTLEKAKPHDRR
ncbi:MAG: polymerase [Nocardioides sp.]|nr:polymerase [Nocardioides sp.]